MRRPPSTPPPSGSRRAAGPWANALLALGSLVVSLLLGEVAARIVLPRLPDPPGTAYIGDRACGYRLRPSAPGELPNDEDHHINAYGFRDRDYPAAKPAGVTRVLGMGDSFVYGAVSVRYNYLRVAERELARTAPALRAEVWLFGLPGYSPENEVGLLKEMGLGLHPDLVLLSFYVGNDVTGIPVRGRVIRGRLYWMTSQKPWLNVLRRSQLFVLAETVLYREWKQRLSGAKPGREPDLDLRFGPTPVNDLFLHIMALNLPVYLRHPDPANAELWSEAEGYLTQFDALCRGAHVPWVLVIVPEEVQVDPEVRAEVLRGLRADSSAYDFDLPQRRLHRLADRLGVEVVDPLAALRAAHRPDDRLYVPNDTHWSVRGNALAGEMVADAIRRRLAAPAR